MLKRRLARLEQNVKEEQYGEGKLCVVRQDIDRDRMVIADLNFYGTINDGELLIKSNPNILFVVLNFMDTDYSDDEWNQQVQSWFNLFANNRPQM